MQPKRNSKSKKVGKQSCCEDQLQTIGVASFYILNGAILYNRQDGGAGHSSLWQRIIERHYSCLDFDSKEALVNAPYGVGRGRLVKTKGTTVVYATAILQACKDKIRTVLKVKEPIRWVLNDEHYHMLETDHSVIELYAAELGTVKLTDLEIRL